MQMPGEAFLIYLLIALDVYPFLLGHSALCLGTPYPFCLGTQPSAWILLTPFAWVFSPLLGYTSAPLLGLSPNLRLTTFTRYLQLFTVATGC